MQHTTASERFGFLPDCKYLNNFAIKTYSVIKQLLFLETVLISGIFYKNAFVLCKNELLLHNLKKTIKLEI